MVRYQSRSCGLRTSGVETVRTGVQHGKNGLTNLPRTSPQVGLAQELRARAPTNLGDRDPLVWIQADTVIESPGRRSRALSSTGIIGQNQPVDDGSSVHVILTLSTF
jgi:hypothetical protein